MKTREFFDRVDHEKIVSAIQAAEAKTSGEIRVYVSRKEAPDPLREGTKHFAAMNMHKTKARNAVLFFVAPRSNTFAVIGDEAIHQLCGQEFWARIAEEMTSCFKEVSLHRASSKASTQQPIFLQPTFLENGMM